MALTTVADTRRHHFWHHHRPASFRCRTRTDVIDQRPPHPAHSARPPQGQGMRLATMKEPAVKKGTAQASCCYSVLFIRPLTPPSNTPGAARGGEQQDGAGTPTLHLLPSATTQSASRCRYRSHLEPRPHIGTFRAPACTGILRHTA